MIIPKFLIVLIIFASLISCKIINISEQNQSIQIHQPNSDTQYKLGDNLYIRWASDNMKSWVKIDLYKADSFIINIAESVENNGSYRGAIDETLEHGEDYSIRISELGEADVAEFSEEFIIYKIVEFPDENLNKLIMRLLGNPNEITTKELVFFNELEADNNKIYDLQGIENCQNLIKLNLIDNRISNIQQLSKLKQLKQLKLSNNQIIEISMLESLSELELLFLSGNNISEINNLNNFTNLTDLRIANNQLTDISAIGQLPLLKVLSVNDNLINNIAPLSHLPNLEFMNLSQNAVKDISVLADLPNLKIILLSDNQIEDIMFLVNNLGINDGDVIILTGNPLNEVSINTYIPQLIERGVSVTF